VRAADSVLNHASKAIEIEYIQARLSELERATEASRQMKKSNRRRVSCCKVRSGGWRC